MNKKLSFELGLVKAHASAGANINKVKEDVLKFCEEHGCEMACRHNNSLIVCNTQVIMILNDFYNTDFLLKNA